MIPAAPTDNLYKFITFLGIVLFVFCTWTLRESELTIDREVTRAEAAAQLVSERLDSIGRRLEEAQSSAKSIQDRWSRRAEAPLSDDEVVELRVRSEQVIDQFAKIEGENSEVKLRNESILP